MKRTYGKRPGLSAIDTGARRVAPTYGKESFITHARKSTGIVIVDQEAERLVSHMLGLDPSVLRYETQPFVVDLIGRSILRTPDERRLARKQHKDLPGPTTYTPDFLVTLTGGVQRIVEVKLEGYEGDEEYQEKLARVAPILYAHGYEFTRITVPSSHTNPLRLNVPLLHQASLRLDLKPEAEVFARIEQLADEGAATLGAFSSGLGLGISMMPVLLAFGALRMDLHRLHIRRDAPAEPAFGAIDHLQLLWGLEQ